MKAKTGFATLAPERRRQIASMGGHAAHAAGGRGHRWTSDEAKIHGRAGGISVAADREHMAEIGRRGGATVASKPDYMQAIGRLGAAAKARKGGS